MRDAESPTGAGRRRAAALAGHTGDVDAATAFTRDEDPSVRATAFAALARCRALDEPALLRGLRDPDSLVRARCATLAATFAGNDAVAEAVVALLDDDDYLVVESAAWSLGEWTDDNPRLDATLAALVGVTTTHDEPLCREAAVAALGAIGDERGLRAILSACTDKPAVRRRAVLSLAPFDGPEVEAAIDKALTDRDWQVRQAAEDLRR